MSSLQNSIPQITNSGIPQGLLVSDDEYPVTGNTEMMLTVVFNGGSGTIQIDNGNGFVSEALVEGISMYDLKQCKMKVNLIGGCTAAAS